MKSKSSSFFVGYLKVPTDLKKFLLISSLMMILGFLSAAVVIGATQDDGGKAGFLDSF